VRLTKLRLKSCVLCFIMPKLAGLGLFVFIGLHVNYCSSISAVVIHRILLLLLRLIFDISTGCG